MPKKFITKAIQTAIDNHSNFVWIQDNLRNIFLCRITFHENGREITRKPAGSRSSGTYRMAPGTGSA